MNLENNNYKLESSKFDKDRVLNNNFIYLIGMCHGIASYDNITNKQKGEIKSYIIINRLEQEPICITILNKLDSNISDNELIKYLKELKPIIVKTHEDKPKLKKLNNDIILKFDTPKEITFKNKVFVFTQIFICGERKKLEEYVSSKGGIVKRTIILDIDYLIVGSETSVGNSRITYGRKYEMAYGLREENNKPLIISEEHFLKFMK